MGSATEPSSFELRQDLKCEYSPHSFKEYVSRHTGMRLVVVDQPGPRIQGFFSVATEIHDDSGAPHTLEHLCFMGSKNFPYKGLLDKLATRAYSATNAWTSTDNTTYTIETGGYTAFAQMLPIYLEHILLPTLTDDGCYTEVHHVDGTGHDAGVVYSEMQGVQNGQSELIDLRAKRLMYSEGIGFRYETGGMMENLRVLTADRIRQFHQNLYRPENLCVIVVGEVDHVDLLATLDKFETDVVLPHVKLDPNARRPWIDSTQPSPLQKSIVETVEFPDEDESSGEISIRYFGPHFQDGLQKLAVEILLSYLAGSSASVLENVLVEKEQMASAVYCHQVLRPRTIIDFDLTGVDSKRLAETEKRFLALLDEAAVNPLDMKFMRECIDREIRQRKIGAERLESFFTDDILNTFLFSSDRTLKHMTTLSDLESLRDWEEKDWRNFLKKWFVDNPRVTILGKPSAGLAQKIKEDEEQRVEKQIQELGSQGLEKLAEKLLQAQANNDKPIPEETMRSFKIPSTDTIHFISTTAAEAGLAKDEKTPESKIQSLVDKDKTDLPLYLHFEHIPTNFVSISILFNTSNIPVSLRPLLPVYMEYLFNQPVQRNGQRLEFETTVKELQNDLVDFDIVCAGAMNNSELLSIRVNVEIEKYKVAIEWIKDLLWNGLFEADRVQATATRVLADVPEEKRSGSDMVYAVSDMVNDAPESLARARGVLVKSVFLKRMLRILKTDPSRIIQQFEDLRTALCDLSAMRVLVVADAEKLVEPVASWKPFVECHDVSKALQPLDKRVDRFSDAGQHPGNRCYVIPMSTIDSSFALATSLGPIDSKDPRVPALMVAISFLDAIEGPMWTAVRGTGLAYGTGFCRRIGRLEFSVYSSPDACKAFSAARAVIEGFVSGSTKFDPLALEGAVSSIVLALVSSAPTMETAAIDNFSLQVVKELPRSWNEILLAKIRAVTATDIQAAMKDLLLPLFTAKSSNLFVTIAPIMKDAIVEGLQSQGFEPEVRALKSFEDDYGLTGPSEEGSDEDEDEEDDEDEDEDDEDEDESGASNDDEPDAADR